MMQAGAPPHEISIARVLWQAELLAGMTALLKPGDILTRESGTEISGMAKLLLETAGAAGLLRYPPLLPPEDGQ
jgi:TPP-dependent 2-oxoacid decarboxylase